jgi:hypothetical protein
VTQFQYLNQDKLGRVVHYRLKETLKKQRQATMQTQRKHAGGSVGDIFRYYDDDQQCTFTP